jgi:hypothetical protein
MRTSMHIPETLLKEAMKVSGAPTQTQAVLMGLEELIRKKRLEALLTLKGSEALKLNQEDLEKMRGR